MKLFSVAFLCTILAAVLSQAFAQDFPSRNPSGIPGENRRRTIQDGPRDLLKETLRQAEKEAAEKNFKEMKDAAAELVVLSKQLSEEIDRGSEHVISVKLVERVEKIEKLVKEIRNRATDY